MADRYEWWAAEQVDRLLSRVLAGRRPDVRPNDAIEHPAILTGVQLAGARHAYPRMSPAFRRRLGDALEAAARPPSPRPMTRRGALVAGASAALGAVTGAALERVVGLGLPIPPAAAPTSGPAPGLAGAPAAAGQPAAGVLEPAPAYQQWVDTGLVFGEMIEGEPVDVAAGAIRAFVVREGDHIRAVSAYCTHLPCKLSVRVAPAGFGCPCHGVEFDPLGNPISPPYPVAPLPAVRTRINGGRVEVLGTLTAG